MRSHKLSIVVHASGSSKTLNPKKLKVWARGYFGLQGHSGVHPGISLCRRVADRHVSISHLLAGDTLSNLQGLILTWITRYAMVGLEFAIYQAYLYIYIYVCVWVIFYSWVFLQKQCANTHTHTHTDRDTNRGLQLQE